MTAKEVKTAVWKMTNNDINVELIKYAPEEIYKEIANILKLGTGILLQLQKPKETQGPVKNLSSITLLEVIRKILSKILHG